MKRALTAILISLLLLSGASAEELLGKTKAEIKEALGKPFMDLPQGPCWKGDKLYRYVEFQHKGPRNERKANAVKYEAYTLGAEITEAERKELMTKHGEFGAAVTDDIGFATYYHHLSKDRRSVAQYSLGKESGKTRTMEVVLIERLSDKTKKLLGL